MDSELLKALIGLCVMVSILAFVLIGYFVYKICCDAFFNDKNNEYEMKYKELKQVYDAKVNDERQKYYNDLLKTTFENGRKEGLKCRKRK